MIRRYNDTCYFASDDGRIYSIKRGLLSFKELRQYQDPKGYRWVTLYYEEYPHRRRRPVHQLVAETFLGPKSYPEYECRHLDGTKDNKLSNIVWGTAEENRQDSINLRRDSVAWKWVKSHLEVKTST